MYRPSKGSISLSPLSRESNKKKKKGNQSTGVKNNVRFIKDTIYMFRRIKNKNKKKSVFECMSI